MAAISAPDAYMRFVSAVIHAVRVMRSEEGHQSVNLKENRQISPSPSRQTKERRWWWWGGIQSSRAKSAPLRDGEGGLEVVVVVGGGLRHSPRRGASFYKVHHITLASHFHRYITVCLPPKPACYAGVFCLKQD